MIQSSIIPRATARHQESGFGLGRNLGVSDSLKGHGGRGEGHQRPAEDLYDEEDPALFSTTLSSSLGLSLPNPAPSVELDTSDDGEFYILWENSYIMKCGVVKSHSLTLVFELYLYVK